MPFPISYWNLLGECALLLRSSSSFSASGFFRVETLFRMLCKILCLSSACSFIKRNAKMTKFHQFVMTCLSVCPAFHVPQFPAKNQPPPDIMAHHLPIILFPPAQKLRIISSYVISRRIWREHGREARQLSTFISVF